MRIKPLDVCMSDSMPFQQHWEAKLNENLLEAIEDKELFLDVRSMLKPGDVIAVCSYEKERLRQYATVRVVEVTQSTVETILDGKVVTIPVPDMPIQKMPKEILAVKREFGGGYTVQDEKGNVVERTKTKQEAVELATA